MTAIAYSCPRCGSADLEVIGVLRGTVYKCRACGFTFNK